MHRSIENMTELGVNLLIAAATMWLLLVVIGLGREVAISIETQNRHQERTMKQVEYGNLNGSTVTYGKAIELVTFYAGELDIYVDRTCDGGAILISDNCYIGAESMTTVTAASATFGALNSTKTIWLNPATANCASAERYKIKAAKMLFDSNLSEKFSTGKWQVLIAVNGEPVGNCAGKVPASYDVVTGIRLRRIN